MHSTVLKLDISKNYLRALGTAALAKSLERNTAVTTLNAASNQMTIGGAGNGDMSGVICLSAAIRDNRALTSLNLASNLLNAEGAEIVAEAIKVTNCAIAVILAPFSCPSGRWLNCCWLLLSTG
jgi:hypothetical protein